MMDLHSDNRQSALQKATYAADLPLVQELLSKQIDVHAQNPAVSAWIFSQRTLLVKEIAQALRMRDLS